MAAPTSKEVADLLQEYGVLLEINGANSFRTRAYTNAARVFETQDIDVAARVLDQTLTDIKGVGKGVAELVIEYVQQGHSQAFEDLKSGTPAGLLDMLKVQGLGAKKVRAIYEELKIDTLDGLEAACRREEISALSGFGLKTEAKILQSIAYLRQNQGSFRMDTAQSAATELYASLAAHPATIRVAIAGSLRRQKETVKDIDMVLSTTQPQALSEAFAAHPLVTETVAQGDTKTTVRLHNGMQADLRVVADEHYPYILHHFTGSKEHNVQLRARAQSLGCKLNEYGLQRDGQAIDCADEDALFAALDLHPIQPELREGRGEIEAAAQGPIPPLITTNDIVGMLHIHSTYSDGRDSLKDMALAVKERGYQYLGISDHSQAAAYAGGLKPKDILRQHEEIDALNNEIQDFKIFKGIEADILPDGSLDYDDEILGRFDFVVASIHSSFNMPIKTMTARLIRAIEHPACTILGHLTGRLLLEREGYTVDTDAIIAAAAEHSVAIEINASPYRLDMDWRHIKKARDQGVKIAVNTDAHRIAQLDYIDLGVGIARKGWLRPQDVINTLDTDAAAAYFRQS
jgi:DNA polymerase (family 10)